jgi:putative Mg2+ transporter-C (MgtC) family protein
VPPADYVLEVVCRGDAESAVRALIIEAGSGGGLQVKSLRSTDTETPGEIALRAEMSAARRDDTRLENALRVLSSEPAIRSVRWSIQDQAAAGWTGRATD